MNRGPAEEFAPEDRDAQVARLLTVRGDVDDTSTLFERKVGGPGPGGLTNMLGFDPPAPLGLGAATSRRARSSAMS